MKIISRALILSIIVSALLQFSANADNALLKGDTYSERSAALIDCMVQSKPAKKNSVKYLAPFYFARFYRKVNTDEASRELMRMYKHELNHRDRFHASGSYMDFCVHATMHGYLLTKDRLPDELRQTIRSFMQMGKYIRKNVTLNMSMMQECSGYLCAQEWPDFVDADGNDAEAIRKAVRSHILSTINKFITDNCPEADAFTYIGTNLQYLRMLAEFCDDDELRQSAEYAYQHIILNMVLPWNEGLYCSNPPRSKGWHNLQTGNLNSETQICQLAWLFYGAGEGRYVNTAVTDTDNYGCFNFWAAYRGKISPLPEFADLYRSKNYPYSFDAMRVEDKHYSTHHTYMSDNYGLSTQYIEAKPGRFKDFQYTYAFKETKNLHLVWRSDKSENSVFSVCIDNPNRPQRFRKDPNKPGYGENPYHRVFGRGTSAIGMYIVPVNYMDKPDFYRMYVPFSRKGIKKRVIKKINGMEWILCHTGSMMFGFATPEATVWAKPKSRFEIAGHDILILEDSIRRRGSWILETTEITDRLKDNKGNISRELDNFADLLKENTSISLSDDYEYSATPTLTYTNPAGERLQLTYYSPDTPYNGQYLYNGKAVDLDLGHLSRSQYLNQKVNCREIIIHGNSGDKSINLK